MAFVLGVKEANKQGFLQIFLEDCTNVLKMTLEYWDNISQSANLKCPVTPTLAIYLKVPK